MLSPVRCDGSRQNESLIRVVLGILLSLLALNAFGGGYYGMAGAKGVPLAWLKGSPFTDYFIPGLFLFVFIGGSSAVAAVVVFRRHPSALRFSMLSGGITLVWIVVQVSIIGYVSWMQPVTTVTALLIIFLTRKLKKYVH